MATTTQDTAVADVEFPSWATEDWQTAYLRVKGPWAARRLWDRVLTGAERERLGGDWEVAYDRHRSAAAMWMCVRGVSLLRAVVGVAVAIRVLEADDGRTLLQALGAESDDPADAVENAVDAGGLVLVEVPRQAYWDGASIEIDWPRHTSQWELLWALARASKGGGAVDAFALRERDGGDRKFVTKRKCRLVNAAGFPLTLADLVVSAGRGAYRLNLPPARIRVFERGAGDSVREWAP